MTDPNLLRKDRQDEARRQQQTDERIRELEEENERLRSGIKSLLSSARSVHRAKEPVDPRLWRSLSASINTADDALNGRGDTQ